MPLVETIQVAPAKGWLLGFPPSASPVLLLCSSPASSPWQRHPCVSGNDFHADRCFLPPYTWLNGARFFVFPQAPNSPIRAIGGRNGRGLRMADYVRGRRLSAGRSPPAGASVAFALILSLDSWQIAEKSGPIPIFPRRFPLGSQRGDPVRSRWDASGPHSVCPTCQTRSTSKLGCSISVIAGPRNHRNRPRSRGLGPLSGSQPGRTPRHTTAPRPWLPFGVVTPPRPARRHLPPR